MNLWRARSKIGICVPLVVPDDMTLPATRLFRLENGLAARRTASALARPSIPAELIGVDLLAAEPMRQAGRK